MSLSIGVIQKVHVDSGRNETMGWVIAPADQSGPARRSGNLATAAAAG